MTDTPYTDFADAFINVMLEDLEMSHEEDTGTPIILAAIDIDSESYEKIVRKCASFYSANEHLINAPGACKRSFYNGSPEKHAGSDLYMTWYGHGVGFWDDGCWATEQGEELDAAVKELGYFGGAYIGDDGKVHVYIG